MRPMLNPAVRALWRDERTLQFGIDVERARVLTGVDDRAAKFLPMLDGTRSRDQAIAAGRSCGLSRVEAKTLIDLLGSAGAVMDADADHVDLSSLTAAERDRMAPDVAAWSVGADGASGAARTLRARRGASVAVHGAGRVGATVAGLLAAAGIRSLSVTDARSLRPADVSPGGVRRGLQMARDQAAMAAARAVAPDTGPVAPDTGPATLETPPDVVVVCPDGAQVDPVEQHRLADERLPHVVAHTYEQVGVVGPFVIPGRTPCLHCLDLHRADRDRAWPLLAAQLTGQPRRLDGGRATDACDVVLAAAVAAVAALSVLTYLDDPTAWPDLAGSRGEIRPPDLSLRRRSWRMHPACPCGWPE